MLPIIITCDIDFFPAISGAHVVFLYLLPYPLYHHHRRFHLSVVSAPHFAYPLLCNSMAGIPSLVGSRLVRTVFTFHSGARDTKYSSYGEGEGSGSAARFALVYRDRHLGTTTLDSELFGFSSRFWCSFEMIRRIPTSCANGWTGRMDGHKTGQKGQKPEKASSWKTAEKQDKATDTTGLIYDFEDTNT